MSPAISTIALTAASIGLIHTLCGPDHYLPFIAMSKARNWRMVKTLWITFLCGLGHVLSSVILGFIGVALGTALARLETFEACRGNLAAQALIIFGFTYAIWGLHLALRKKAHTHSHETTGKSLTPWVLFTIFILGPCEPLIPLIMYPTAEHSLAGTFLVAGVFAITTIGTMLSVVLLSSWGLRFVHIQPLERFSHAIAGVAIGTSGLAIQLLGL